MYEHGSDPESDEEEYDETLRPYIRWRDITCGGETCGDIIRDIIHDEERYAIYANWTGHIGRDNSIPPKRRFWKDAQKMKSGFSKHF